MATPSEDADDYNQLVAKIAGLSQENTDIENLTTHSVTLSASSDDLYSQLQQKELDLKLTAELGKALLEKNQDLKRRNEQLVEEFYQRLEELTQEKHELRLRLEVIEGQYELTVRDLQHEVTQLREDFADQEETMRVGERAHSQTLQDAKRHNDQLSEQIHKVRGKEAGLQTQVEELREQLQTRRVSMQDYIHKVEALREEIGKLTAVRVELDCRVNILTSERNMHVCSLEDAHDRIVTLERHRQDEQEQLMYQEREINELREQNLCLQDNVGNLALQSTSDLTLEADTCNNSLFRELRVFNTKSTSTESLDTDVFSQTSVSLRQELMDVYQQMRQMMNDLEGGEVGQGHETSNTPQMEPQQALCEVQSGSLQSLLRKLHEQMEHTVNMRVNQLMRPNMEKIQQSAQLEQKVQELQIELDAALIALNNFNCHAHQSTSTSDLSPPADRGDDSLLSGVKTTSTELLDVDVFNQSASVDVSGADAMLDPSELLKQEIVEVYQQIRQMVNDLGGGGEMGQGHTTHISSPKVEPQQALDEIQSGDLQSLLRKLREQMERAVNMRVNQHSEPAPEQLQHSEQLEQKVEQLQNDLTGAEATLNKLKVELKLREMELKRKSDDFMQLTSEIKHSEPAPEQLQHNEQLEKKVEQLQNDLTGAEATLNKLKVELKLREIELKQKSDDFMQLTSEIKLMQPSVEKIQHSAQLEQKVQELQNELDAALIALNDFNCHAHQSTSTSDLSPPVDRGEDSLLSDVKTISTELLDDDVFNQSASVGVSGADAMLDPSELLKQELVEVYQQIRQMVNDLGGGEMGQGHTTHISSPKVEPQQAMTEIQSGDLQSLLQKLREQMEHTVNMRVNQHSEPAPEQLQHNEQLEKKVEQLQNDLTGAEATLNKLKVELKLREIELKQKSDDFMQLTSEIKLMRPSVEKIQHSAQLEQKVQELQIELDAALIALNDFNCHAHQSTSTSDLSSPADRGDDSLLSDVKTTSTELLDDDVFNQSASVGVSGADAMLDASELLKQEVMEVYQQIRQMVNDLGGGEMGQGHTTHIRSSKVEPQQALAEIQSGDLQSLLRKLREQMEHTVNMRVNQHSEPAPEQLQHNEQLEKKVEQLQNDLTEAEATLNKLKVELKLREIELKQKSDDFMQLTSEIKLMRPSVEKIQHSAQLEQKVQELQNELDAALIALNDFNCHAHQSTSTSDLSSPADRGDDSLLSDVKTTSTELLDDDVFNQSASVGVSGADAMLDPSELLKQEVMEVYQQIRQMVNDLGGGEMGQGHTTHIRSSKVEPQQALAEIQSGDLQSLLRKLREQMEHTVNMRVNQHSEPAPEQLQHNEQLEKKVEQLQNDLTGAEATLNKLKVELKLREIELKQKSDDFMQLTSEIKLMRPSVEKIQHSAQLEQKVQELQNELDAALIALNDFNCHAHQSTSTSDLSPPADRGDDSLLSDVKTTSTELLDDDVFNQSASVSVSGADAMLDPSELLKQEVMEVYQQIRQMVNDLGDGEMGQGHTTHIRSSKVEPQQALAEIQSGDLQSLLRKLREQMEHTVNMRVNQHSEPAPEQLQHNEQLEKKVEQLQNDLTGAEATLNKLKVELKLREIELKRKSDDLMQLTSEIKLMRPSVEKIQHSAQLEQKVQELQNELDAALIALNDFNCHVHQSTSTSDLSPPADRGEDSLLSDVKTISTELLDDDVFNQSASVGVSGADDMLDPSELLKQELVEVYQQIRQMVNDLGGGEMGQGHTTRISSPKVEPQQHLAEIQSGDLQSLLRKLREQMEHTVNMRVNQHSEPAPEQLQHSEQLEQKVEQLQNDLTGAEATLNKLKVELKLREMELKRKSDDFMQLTSEIKLSLQQQELVTLQIERDRLQDQSAGVVTRDDIIEQARQSRDDAISRRNAMEVELARAKLDLMNLERQLMEAVQQKLQLSQQLEQWQMDMQELVDTQMMKRMELETKRVERSRGSPQSALRKFKFSWS